MSDSFPIANVLEAAQQAGVDLPHPDSWPGEAQRVFTASGFLSQTFRAQPALLADLLRDNVLTTAYTDATQLTQWVRNATLNAANREQLMQLLRQTRTAQMARIAWRDLAGLATLEETLRDLSAFADAAIDSALEQLDKWQRERRGVPTSTTGDPQRLVVFALGKLGAEELNFSSDVDLIFAFPQHGETQGVRRSISNNEYFLQLGRSLIEVLQKRTGDGYVFRVDMRLRPFGRAGALAMNFATMEDYYQRHGRDWERYALIRMRPIAGDIEAGNELLRTLEPFVYKRYMDFGTLESLREMKAMIAEEVATRGLDDHVKLGPGGIREVEFTTQAFQLVRGGRMRALRSRKILTVLAELSARSLLPQYAVRGLVDAYRFLRRSENLLQEFDDKQTHQLPCDAAARSHLAQCMGFASWDEYLHTLNEHRARVREQFDQVLGAPDDGELGSPDGSAHALMTSQDEQGIEHVLAAYGFTDCHQAAVHWLALRDGFDCRRMDETGERRLKRLAPDLLRAIAASDEPITTLERVLSVITKILRRSTYLALLHERPLAVSHLVRLCAASPWITRRLADQPQLLDELLDARTLYAPPDGDTLDAEMSEHLANVQAGDQEQAMALLRQFKHRQVLRVAAADIAGALPLMKVSDHLTAIAETVLKAALRLAQADIRARHGQPHTSSGTPAELIVVAYGKLGGIELGYSSDLDIVFVHDEAHGTTDGAKPVDPLVYFTRVSQRIVHYLSTMTADGIAYEVDTRLRPHGKDGVLACSLESFQRYQQEQAWTWEHQALIRARPVAGDKAVAHRFMAVRDGILLTPREESALLDAVRSMRHRMRSELGSRGEESFNLKQDAGGITDIEFMVQYATLRFAHALGAHLQYTDNIRLLEGLAASGSMPAEDAGALADAYRELRAETHRLALQEQPAVTAGTRKPEATDRVTEIWRRLMHDDAPK